MKIVLCFSGGMDSSVLLHEMLNEGHQVKAISINYGQRHLKELEIAKSITASLGIEHKIMDLSPIAELLCGSALTDKSISVPHGHYQAENMKLTVVPNRNMIFLSLAAAWALSLKFDAIAIAAHGGDHAIYPDCRKEFMQSMQNSLALADWNKVELLTPFIGSSKTEICTRGAKVNVPFELTWSCYQGGAKHCGQCGTCVERKEAFLLANVPDPTTYET